MYAIRSDYADMATVHQRAGRSAAAQSVTPKGPAPAFVLKSTAFRAEREPAWRRLEALITRAEKSGLASLSARELLRLSYNFV